MGKQKDTPAVDERSEQERYAEIVADVKAQAREQTPKRGGAWTTLEIQRRWAEANGRTFDQPEPGGDGGVGSTAVSPPATHNVGPVKSVDDAAGKRPATHNVGPVKSVDDAAGKRPATPKETRLDD